MPRANQLPLVARYRWRRLSIRIKMLIPVLIAFLVAFIVILWRVPPSIGQLVEENVRGNFSKQLESLRTQITAILIEGQNDLLDIANSREMIDFLAAQSNGDKADQLNTQSIVASQFLSKINDDRLPYAEIRYLNWDGNQMIRAEVRYIGNAISGVLIPTNDLITEKLSAYAEDIVSPAPGKGYILPPKLGKVGQESGFRLEPVMEIAVPIYYENQLVGFIIGSFRTHSWFTDTLGKPTQATTSQVTLADRRAIILAATSKTSPNGVILFGEETTILMSPLLPINQLDANEGTLQTIKDRVYMSLSLSDQGSVPHNQWILIVSDDWNAVYADAQMIELTLVLTLAAGLAIITLGIGFVSQSIIRPLVEVSQVADQIAAGDLRAKAPMRSEDEVGMVALALNTMSVRLSELIYTLENRVSERTRDLEVAAEVARQVTKALELNDLLSEVVERTRSGFALYEVAVLLYDEEANNLLLAAAAGNYTVQTSGGMGEVINLDITKGHLARAVATKSIVLENDVSKSKDFVAHPDMAEMKAELVLPMLVGNKLLGVLDVQHNYINGFSGDDVRVFTSLADQIAIAIRNAQLFVEMQAARKETEILFHISQAMNAATSYVDIVEAIAHELLDIPYHVSLSIFENYDRPTATFSDTVATYYPDQKKALERHHRTNFPPGGLKSPASFIIKDTEKLAEVDEKRAALYRQANVRAVLAAGISLGQREIGVLSFTYSQPHEFSPLEYRLIAGAADLAAAAVERGRLLQEADTARQTAEEANRIKSQFLANMSHELRTPLNAILNFSAFVADGLMGPVNEEQAETLQQSIMSGKHLLSLINDILDVTKIEAGLMELFIQKVEFSEVLAAAVSVAKGLVKDKPIALVAEIEDDLPSTYGDKRRLRQVFLNLVSNAIKFTPQGKVKINARHQDSAVQVSVSDTGIGIAPEDLNRIFESFKQAKTDLLETVGTGLGLPISKYFVESHGGKIWVESTVGVGSAFHVVLPILTEEQARSKNAENKG